MKIAVAQIQSLKGLIKENIEVHLKLIEKACENSVDIILFPELSITNYTTDLSTIPPITLNDACFDVFQNISNTTNLFIAIGAPLTDTKGTYISLVFFQPHQDRIAYHKQMLDDDEIPFFIPGSQQTYITLKQEKIAFGICFESLQPLHFFNAQKAGTTIYMASVAKHQKGIEKANRYFLDVSKSNPDIPILMANSIGASDAFLNAGQSAVWYNGTKKITLDNQHQGLLIFDTSDGSTHKIIM